MQDQPIQGVELRQAPGDYDGYSNHIYHYYLNHYRNFRSRPLCWRLIGPHSDFDDTYARTEDWSKYDGELL